MTISPISYLRSIKTSSLQKDRSVAVVRTFEDLLQAIAIRSQVYIAEQDCPWDEEFDQNDLCATHLIIQVENEPAGTLRLRYFAEFVKLERLAVLPKFRRQGLAARLVKTAHSLAAMKGFGAAYIHAQTAAAPFWSKLGYAEVPRRPSFSFSGFSYTEMTCDIDVRAPFGIHSDPMVLNRPEGAWEAPGPMEGGAAGMGVAAND